MVSRELNACCPARSKSKPRIICPRTAASNIVNRFLKNLGVTESAEVDRQKLSVRFTRGRISLFAQKFQQQFKEALNPRLKSSVQVGNKGHSLGFHLVTSSDGRNVITLHGSSDDLLADLASGLFNVLAASKDEIDKNRQSLRNGKISEVLQKRCSDCSTEVMALRIVNPTPPAAMACARLLGGEVYFDSKTKAIYPIHYKGGNLELCAACAIILDAMKKLEAGDTSMQEWQSRAISFQEIF